MACFAVKSEPGSYSFDDLVRDGRTAWDGVRNPEARNNLRAMKRGDRVLFYHSGSDKAVVGVARVVRSAYPEPDAPEWVAVDLAPLERFVRRVPLATLKADKRLAMLALVKRPRLSVSTLSEAELERVLALGATVR